MAGGDRREEVSPTASGTKEAGLWKEGAPCLWVGGAKGSVQTFQLISSLANS